MKAVLKLEGLCCANCAAKIEREVQKIPGVTAANLTFMTQKLSIETDGDDIEAIVEQASKIAKKVEGEVQIKRLK
ncbi:MAG: cation transporter [Candidatus Methanomethylophilaceae archaeon]|nr:cation transporter [Candidatus Methanomethylophilaceae archaeon]